MENKEQQSAESTLRTYAETLKVPFKDFYHLLNKAYIDDEAIMKRMQQQNQYNLNLQQQHLNLLQYKNESMQNQLMSFDLEKKVRQLNRKKAIRKFFGLDKTKKQ